MRSPIPNYYNMTTKLLHRCFKRALAVALTAIPLGLIAADNLVTYVNPMIGAGGHGHVFVGASVPFGNIQLGPTNIYKGWDWCSGYHYSDSIIIGFAHNHLSGTGCSDLGDVGLMPFTGEVRAKRGDQNNLDGAVSAYYHHANEKAEAGYYSVRLDNGIFAELTATAHVGFHHYIYNKVEGRRLLIDLVNDVGSRVYESYIRKVDDYTIEGYRFVKGWSPMHKTFFYARFNQKIKRLDTFQDETPMGQDELQTNKVKGVVSFDDGVSDVLVKVAISSVSCTNARMNLEAELPGWDFAATRKAAQQQWNKELSCIHIDGTPKQKTVFYTALYHTMLMPVCKTGENPRWQDAPYYDDYYAIWDTYRTSSPLLTLLCPEREVELVNALLNIYRREGYLPDARSGDSNGRTQGGSNAEVVIADAFAKGLGSDGSIDYGLALEAMLKDGEADPGADHEKHGRGGLTEYKRLGYVPYSMPRAGTRTVEYAYDDFCLAQVAKGLGRQDIYERYMQRSRNWRNLWRSDYEWDDVSGYIMPRDAEGRWLDSVPWGKSKVFHPTIPYTPVTKVAPWYLPWWDTFFYEALSAEYSLSIPHDVPGLIDACGGSEAFRRRLNLFFERGRYNVGNEPSFLTPCLYHWLGRPDLSTQRIHQIVRDNYSDRPDGLPGNDDSGAMSSWLAFHMMGLYPNAGQDYYLLNLPLLPAYTLQLPNGKQLRVSSEVSASATAEATSFRAVFNGQELPNARITHQQLMEGGTLVYKKPHRTHRTHRTLPEGRGVVTPANEATEAISGKSIYSPPSREGQGVGPGGLVGLENLSISFTLNRQFRTWPLSFGWDGDTLEMTCKHTRYRIARSEVEHATGFCWLHPQQDGNIYNNVKGTFLFVSADAIRQLRERGFFVYDSITWREQEPLHVRADVDGTEMWIEQRGGLYLVKEMRGNPLGIDWKLVSAP